MIYIEYSKLFDIKVDHDENAWILQTKRNLKRRPKIQQYAAIPTQNRFEFVGNEDSSETELNENMKTTYDFNEDVDCKQNISMVEAKDIINSKHFNSFTAYNLFNSFFI